MITHTTVNTNPFPGLRPFEEDENYLFFGRETQVDQMLSKLQHKRFLAVIGTSGSGKSSLVNCGLFPALHGGYLSTAGSSWRVAKFRPGNDPIREMALALARRGTLFLEEKVGNLPIASMLHINLLRSKLGLIESYKQARLKPHQNLLVVVDQFEELFRYQKLRGSDFEDNAVSFVNLLLEAVRQTALPIYVVITMRSDFLGDCARFRGLPEMINEGQYLVPRMKRNERKSAISGPVEVAGARMTDRLLMRLVNDVGDNPDQLSILQHALNRTWAAWENEGAKDQPLDLPHYQQIGTMSKALDQHAEKAYHELPDERHKQVCQKIFKALTDVGTDSRGVRRPTQMKKLCEIVEAKPGEVQAVIDIFRKPSRSFLMPPAGTPLEDNTIVDISHESFMRIWKRLIRWTKDEQESVRTYLRLSDAAMLYEQGNTALMTDPYLQFALNWKEEEKVNEAWAQRYDDNFTLVMDYIRKSRREKQLKEAEAKAAAEAEQKRKEEEQEAKLRSQRKRFTIARIVGAIFIVLTGVMGYLYYELQQSEEEFESKNKDLNILRSQIFDFMGVDTSLAEIDVKKVFEVYDTLNSIRSVKDDKLYRTDAQLAGMYELLLDENHSTYLDPALLKDLEKEKAIIAQYDSVSYLDGLDTVTLAEKLSGWREVLKLDRNTPEYELALEKYTSYQEDSASNAFLPDDSNIVIFSADNDDVRPDSLTSTNEIIKLGGRGKFVYAWINTPYVEKDQSNGRIDFYIGDQKLVSKSYSDLPTWNINYYNQLKYYQDNFPDTPNIDLASVMIYNAKGQLIGRKSFKLLE
jgi:energy-coupling factor transporter ATP-binding protein EcfA2